MGGRFKSSVRSWRARLIASVMAATSVVAIRPGHGDPGDIFTIGAPVIGASAPKATAIGDGDASVSTQTGALSYGYPLVVPPGRNGMQPQLALSYSSQGPIYGTIAAGWSLSGIHMISLDTSQGRIAGTRYQSTLAGGRPLIPVNEPSSGALATFRAQNDSSWTRYEQIGDSPTLAKWRAYTTDGTTWYFGETGHGTCNAFTTAYAPLTRAVDKFGNEVSYVYKSGPVAECHIDYIIWGQNTAASIQHFATAKFNYTESPSCQPNVPIGSQISWRTGNEVGTGTSRLNSVTIVAHAPGSVAPGVIPAVPDHRRTVTLAYNAAAENCATTHAPFRKLASIQETASGVDSPQVALPAVTFTYGNASFGDPTAGNLVWPAGTSSFSPPWGNAHPVGGLTHKNLGWGYRYPSGNKLSTIEEMMIDLDGDSLPDRLTSTPVRDLITNAVVRCQAQWQRNLGSGGFAFQPTPIDLPTLKWANPGNGAGGAGANPAIKESCSLNYQQTGFVNSVQTGAGLLCPDGNSCPAPPAPGYCAIGKYDCRFKAASAGQQTVLVYRWIDVDGDQLVDLVASPTRGGLNSYNFYKGNSGVAQVPRESPLVFGDFSDAFGSCPSYTVATGAGAEPYTMCDGKVPWFVYKNHGNGTFGQSSGGVVPWPYPTRVLYQPLPLETSAGESSLNAYPSGNFQGVMDLDGDGFADGGRASAQPISSSWQVWRNDQTGLLLPQSSTAAYVFPTGNSYAFSLSTFTLGGGGVARETEGMFDVHGDGLADHWRASNLSLSNNNGASVIQGPTILSVLPRNEAVTTCAPSGCLDPAGSGFPVRAYRQDTIKTLDLDFDGRMDVADRSSGPWSSRLNIGGNFGNTPSQIGWAQGLLRTIIATDQIPPGYTWEIRSDMIDLDADGIPEGVDFGISTSQDPDPVFWGIPGSYVVSKVPTPIEPPRLLVEINNGRGAITKIKYAPTPKNGKRLPHAQWVVQEVKTTDSLASPQTTSITTYSYTDPMFIADSEGHFAFRGFEKVVTTTPSNSLREETYSFAPDWSGRLAKTVIKPAEFPNEARTIDTTKWEERTLFCDSPGVNCRLKTYHPTEQKHFVCLNGQSEATCSDPVLAGGYSQTISTWTALASTLQGGPPLMWQETSSLLQRGTASQDGDRRQDTQRYLYADGATYRLVVVTVTKEHRVSGAFAMFAHTETKWEDNTVPDSSYRVPWSTAVYVDGNFANRLISARDFDLATGNVTRIWKPAQWMPNQNRVTNLNRTTLGYDTRKLFATNEVNELGHVRDYTFEYGTGTKLATFGPNAPSCAPVSCPGGSPLREEHRIRVDGLGRMIERFEAFDEGTAYSLRRVESNAYVDTPAATVTHQAAIEYIDAATTRYSLDLAELDGQGRPIRTTLFAQGSAAANQVTSYSYRNDGTLSQVTVPDPAANNTSIVAYAYTFDSLGRPKTIRRPEPISGSSDSGVNIDYNGLSQTSTEVVGSGLGQPASTTTRNDVFGRLVQVEEQRTASPIAWSTTTYSYGPDDNVITIVDPQSVTTSMVHDFAGRRTRITRNTRVWTYGYDANGNMSAETTPCTGAGCAAAYTTTVAFDALDRPSSKSLAPRAISTADLTLFGAASETFTWDSGANGKGRMTQWGSFAPGGGTPVTSLSPTYNAQGQETNLSQTTNAAGYSNLSRSFGQVYDISGAIRQVFYRDVVGTANCQNGSLGYYTYDNRGLLQSVQIQGCLNGANTPYSYLTNIRNVAGLVTKRYSVAGVGAITYAESNWTYDKLGRVTDQVINKGSPLVQVARQDLEYFGNDDPKWMDHWLGATNQKHFTFTYDLRHQLTSVGETQLPNAFTATYTYGNAGRFATAVESAAALPNSDVTPRNVTYIYSSTDPERITALRKNPGSKNLATYTYDDAGNQLNRTYPDTKESWDYVYDGKNQLRRVTKKLNGVVQGSEEYWYDNANQRYLSVKLNGSATKTGAIWFIRDSEAHYSATGTVTRAFGHVTMGTPVARIDRSSDAASTLEYQFHGLANNTIASVDQISGTINASFTYAPFGEVIEATNAGAAAGNGLPVHKRRFNDKFVDDVSGLTYYGYRFYDRLSNTWTQSDPAYRFTPESGWSEPRRSNLYTAHGNNPLRYLDPDGRNFANTIPTVADLLKAAAGAAATGNPVGEVLAVALVATAVVAAIATDPESFFRPIDLAEAMRAGKDKIARTPPPMEARPNRDRGRERQNPNPNKIDSYRQKPNGKWERKKYGDDAWKKSGPPPPGHPQAPNAPGAENGAAPTDSSPAPADADGNGTTSDEEEAEWMQRQQ